MQCYRGCVVQDHDLVPIVGYQFIKTGPDCFGALVAAGRGLRDRLI